MNTSTQLIEKGIKQLNNQQFSSAKSSFEQALNQDPHSTDAFVGLARVHFIAKDYEHAAYFTNEALRIQPSNPEALALKGVSSMQNEDWEEAVRWFEKARKADPKLQMIYANLAKSQRKLGNLKAAEEAARTAIKFNPQNDQAHSELSAVLFKLNRKKEGMKEMIEAIRINPLYIRGYLIIARIYQAAGKVDAAIGIYKRGLAFNPLAAPLREALAGAYAFQGDYQNAYKQAVSIALTRSSDTDWLRVGVFAIVLGKFEKGEKAFKKTLSINPNNADAHYNLAELYFAAKLYKKATEHYLLSIQKDNKSFKPFNGLGMLLLMVHRNNDEAKECFIRALERSPGQKEPMLNMALACAANAEYQSAEKFAKAALRAARPGDEVFEQAQRLISQIESN